MDVAQQVSSTTSEVWNCHYTLLCDRRGLKYNERRNLYHCYFQQPKLWKVGCATSETNDRPTLEVSSKDTLKGVLTLVRANTRYSPVSICNPETQIWHFQGWILGGRVAAVTQSQSTSPLLESYLSSTHVSLIVPGNRGIGSWPGQRVMWTWWAFCISQWPPIHPGLALFWELGAFWLGLFPPTAFPSRELKIVPLGWGPEASSEGGICANMGLGEELLPREGGGWGGQLSRRAKTSSGGCALLATAPSILQQRRLLVSSCLLWPYWFHLGKSLHWIPTGLLAQPRLQGGPMGNRDLYILLLVLSLSPYHSALPTQEHPR